MLKIAHRGNLVGPSPRENHPFYIEEAIYAGFDVEVDVRLINKELWLGHDKPQYLTSKSFLDRYKNSLWIHCKNLEALEYFSNLQEDYIYFWHEEDSYALTSNNLIWTYPGKPVTEKSILVLKGRETLQSSSTPFGICSDYVKTIGHQPIDY
jgi:hypothetical protein